MRKVAGVPLLLRVIATAVRAGVDSVLIIWPEGTDSAIWESCAESPLLKGVKLRRLIVPNTFDPRSTASWAALAMLIEDRFLWLPWNWVTHKRILAGLSPIPIRPLTWERPVLMERGAVLDDTSFRVSSGRQADGISIISPTTVRMAERFLVEHSGKPLDGMYSNFNRRLCRPFVRLLTHTRVTPNVLTLAGLLVAILATFLFARGSYGSCVAGAILFFVSGLFDEMDGMLARIKFRESAFGTWFEGFVDNVTYLVVFAGITGGLHRQYGWALKYGIALLVGCLLSVAVIAVQRKLATAPGRPQEYAGRIIELLDSDSSNLVSRVVRHIHIFVKKGVVIHYLLMFTVMGVLPLFLWLAAVGSNLTWILGLYFTLRFFLRAPVQAVGKDIQTAA
jgi:phosphatidylglycerophosphate synthase